MKRSAIALFTVLLLQAPVYSQFGLGKLKKAMKKVGSVSDLKMSEEDEIALGQAVSEQIRKRYGVQQDLEATRYLTLAGRVLAEKSSRSHLPYQFIILDSDAVNAFAAPGGYIHITRGALASLKSEAELAGVLGHEISHVTEKHTLDAIRKMKSIELAEEQTSLGQNSEVFQQVANKTTEAVLQGFGRSEELEADRVEVHLASSPGYTPQGLVGFLETLSLQNVADEAGAGLFASHPETKERIKKLEKEIRKKHLQASNQATLHDRYKLHIRYQVREASEEDLLLEGSRGLSGSQKGKEGNQEDKENQAEKKKEKKKSRFSLSRLKNPLGSGDKKESAEVTGSGGGRAVGKEDDAENSSGSRNPKQVEVEISPEDLQKFKQDGNLK